MGMIDNVRSEMVAAMKNKDKERKEALSALLSALKNVAIDKRADLTDAEEATVVLKEIKQLHDTLEQTPADRTDIIEQCNFRIKVYEEFAPKMMSEDEIKELFLRAANQVIDQKEQFIAIYEQVLSRSLDTTALDSELSDLEAEINIAAELIEECIKENAHVALDQAEYQKRYDGLVARFDKAKARHTEVTDLIAERTARRHQIETYLKELRSREPLTEFRETDWLAMVDYITVYSKDDIRVTLKDGTEIKA